MIEFFIGLLTVNSLLLLWFFSPLKISISEILLRRTLMPNEFDDWVYEKNSFLGKLLSCNICLSFWLSFIVGFLIMILCSLPIYWPILTFFTYPGLCYLYIKIIK